LRFHPGPCTRCHEWHRPRTPPCGLDHKWRGVLWRDPARPSLRLPTRAQVADALPPGTLRRSVALARRGPLFSPACPLNEISGDLPDKCHIGTSGGHQDGADVPVYLFGRELLSGMISADMVKIWMSAQYPGEIFNVIPAFPYLGAMTSSGSAAQPVSRSIEATVPGAYAC